MHQAREISVLLVENDDSDAPLVERLLNAAPDDRFTVDRVCTASSALSRIKQGGVDVVLLDLALPDSEGLDTVLAFRTLFPGLPVVILTAIENESLGLQAVELGAQDYVAKSMVAGQLLFRAIRFAIARQNQIKHYKALAQTDALTGLANRGAFDAELARRLAGWKRNRRVFSLMMLDIDHFKRFNDTYGHLAGDCVLRNLASVLVETLREADFSARIGGEEFAMLLPDMAAAHGIRTVERVLRAIVDHPITFEGELLTATASIGLAEVSVDDGPESLIKRADTALYAAKDAGRSRGWFHDGRTTRQICTIKPAAIC